MNAPAVFAWGQARMSYVDEGPRADEAVLLLHGNPSWSYLYRLMIPGLVARGHRVLAPDLVGMGRSDKPADQGDYTLAAHVGWLSQWLVGEDLERITLFCQDWGGTAGLNLLPLHGERFDRVVASNTGLPEGKGMNKFMEDWLAFSQSVDELPIGALVQGGTTRRLSDAEVAAYLAPFPDGTYQASPKQFHGRGWNKAGTMRRGDPSTSCSVRQGCIHARVSHSRRGMRPDAVRPPLAMSWSCPSRTATV